MKSLYIIRHGKASLEGSDSERGLTEEGHKHAEQITEILQNLPSKIDKIFSSPLNRAILTIKPLSQQLNLEINIVEDLKEKITGDTTGQNLNDAKQTMWSDFDAKLPGGESSTEASNRAISALNSIFEQLEDGQTAAVQCHGTLIALIIHHFDNSFGFEQWKNMTMPDIYKITYENKNTLVEHIGCDSIETFKIGS
jgi:2,3-bisphosphoglycerate-dependent phosphoglycerate mutase